MEGQEIQIDKLLQISNKGGKLTAAQTRRLSLHFSGMEENDLTVVDLEPDFERICTQCGSSQPCTPLVLDCSQCGTNLKRAPRSKTSNRFNPDMY